MEVTGRAMLNFTEQLHIILMGVIQVTCIAQINFRNIDTMVAKLTDKCELGKTGRALGKVSVRMKN
jgi:hypothetical protein